MPTTNYPYAGFTPHDVGGPGRVAWVTSIGDVPPAVVAAEANPSLPALPPTAKIEKVSHQWQTWNNCGPATITMAASVFGRAQDQTAAMNFLKTTPNDKNVRPDELVAYARSLGLQADYRGGGRPEPAEAVPGQRDPGGGGGELPPRAQRLDGALPPAGGLRRRPRALHHLRQRDPPGINLSQPYGKFDEEWQIFNRTYIPVYPPEKADRCSASWAATRTTRRCSSTPWHSPRPRPRRPESAFAWFNVGTNLVALGRTGEAVEAFDRARTLRLPGGCCGTSSGPSRPTWPTGAWRTSRPWRTPTWCRAATWKSRTTSGAGAAGKGQVEGARASYQAALRSEQPVRAGERSAHE